MTDACKNLRSFLSGNLSDDDFYFTDIVAFQKHWRECDLCQEAIPSGDDKLTFISKESLSKLGRNIKKTYDEFVYKQLPANYELESLGSTGDYVPGFKMATTIVTLRDRQYLPRS
jgi:hypothetical protein